VRAELGSLVESALADDPDRCQALSRLLDNCRGLEQESRDRWKGQLVERSWSHDVVEPIVPELANFLPTPGELEEVKRRLRLHLLHDGRLNANVLRVLDRHPDRAVFYSLVDVLEAYDGDPSRSDEIETARRVLADGAFDAPGCPFSQPEKRKYCKDAPVVFRAR
jgi:hypothetical protein